MDLTSKYREEVALILIKAGVEYLETAVAWLHFSAVTANKSPWKRNPAIFPNRQKGRRKTENRFPWLICGKFGLIRKPGKVFSRFLDINVRRVNTTVGIILEKKINMSRISFLFFVAQVLSASALYLIKNL
jgi:hypothetical protein